MEDAGFRFWRVLVVEGDARRRQKLVRAARMPGVEVLEAAHGPGALWALRARGADAAVLPAAGAAELAGWLRGEQPGLAVVVVEGSGVAGLRDRLLPGPGAGVRCDGSRSAVRAALRAVLGSEQPAGGADRALELHRELDRAGDLRELLRALAVAFGAPEGVGELLFLDPVRERVLRLHRGVGDRGEAPVGALSGSDFALVGAARAAAGPRIHEPLRGFPALLLPLRRGGELAGSVVLRLAGSRFRPDLLLELAGHAAPAAAAALARLRAEAELRAERGRWTAVLDALADPVLVVDDRHRVLAANAAALEAARRSASARPPRACFELCRPGGASPPEGCPLAATAREGRPRRRELEGLFGDPGRRYAVSSFPLGRRHGGAVVQVYRDVTRERELAEQLGAAGRLAAAVAHEVRNPLAAMTNAVSLLRDRGGLARDDERLMDIVLEESQRLSRIVGDLLSYARPLRLEPASEALGAWVEATAELVRRDPRAPAGLELGCVVEGSLPELRLDRDKIRQLVWNLLVNAVEASGTGGRVRIRVRSAPDRSGARIEVEDGGPGIPAEGRQRIFEPFETTKAGGTGLGLAVSRQIAELHGGGISVDDSELGGARFTVFLPAAKPLD